MLETVVFPDNFQKKSLSELMRVKSNKLSFLEAATMYQYIAHSHEYHKTKQLALERMYSLCASAQLAEMILWNLGQVYEESGQYMLAFETYSYFKKLFPGSPFIHQGKFNEIVSAFHVCVTYAHDIHINNIVIDLCRNYIQENDERDSEHYAYVLHVMHSLYKELIKKNISIVNHYLGKYRYTWQPTCIMASILRLQELQLLVQEALEFEPHTIDDNNNQHCICPTYITMLQEVKKSIESFFNIHPIQLTTQTDFSDIYNAGMYYITHNESMIVNDCKKTEKCLHALCFN